MAKLMQSLYLQMIMKKNVDMGYEKQSQFNPASLGARAPKVTIEQEDNNTRPEL